MSPQTQYVQKHSLPSLSLVPLNILCIYNLMNYHLNEAGWKLDTEKCVMLNCEIVEHFMYKMLHLK